MINSHFAFTSLMVLVKITQGWSSTLLEQQLKFGSSVAEASILLNNAGISGLCHPSSDQLEPYFPLCSHRLLSDADSRPLFADDEVFYIQNGLLAFLCVCTAALAAGLTMGLLSLDPLVLLIKMRAGSTLQERNQAASLLPIVKQHHLLLVTLLLLNSIANEALPLFLDKIFPSYLAVIVSVVGVLFFGEIIPSAVFTGPDKIKIAARMVPLVRVVMAILCPLAYPIAKLLDYVLPNDGDNDSNMYNRGELSALVRIQYEERLASKKLRNLERRKVPVVSLAVESAQIDYSLKEDVRARKKEIVKRSSSDLSKKRPGLKTSMSIHFDEVSMVEGALTMGTKVALDVYTPLRKLFAIPYDTILDERSIVHIYSSGYSRVPVYDRQTNKERDIQSIRGVLMTKQLIVVSSNDKRLVSTLPLQKPFCISPTKNLIDCINLFQTGGKAGQGGHMALVCARPELATIALDRNLAIPVAAGLMGILTLEDVLEELIQEQIYDEMDRLEQQRRKSVKWAFQKWKLYVKKRKLAREVEELQCNHDELPHFQSIVLDAVRRKHSLTVEHGIETVPDVSTPLLGGSNGSSEVAKPRSRFFGFLSL